MDAVRTPDAVKAHMIPHRYIFYAVDEGERTGIMDRISAEKKKGKVVITRFKGLGEMMPKTLRETTLDPKTRQLIRVSITDELAADRTIHGLMGKDASVRYQFIMERASDADAIDIDI